MSRYAVCLAVALACSSGAIAQTGHAPGPGPMEKVAFLYGRWEGEGRFMRGGQAAPQLVAVTERVYPKLQGQVVLMEGQGTIPGREAGDRITVHDALGVLAWNPAQNAFQMRAFRGGSFVDATVDVGEQRLVWAFEVPQQGLVRYTLTIDDAGRWHEVGEMQRGPDAWILFYEMTLTRAGEA